jgi:LuxR family transcriptional regulator, maltose regulon positive regulatory protein
MGLAARQASPLQSKSLPLLTLEYLTGIHNFTRSYFEKLFDRLLQTYSSHKAGQRFVIVLDNYQNIPSESPFHEMIATGFDAIPDGVRFIVLSRNAPPVPLARFQANGRIAKIDYVDIRFTIDESIELIRSRMPYLEQEFASRIHGMTKGWAAGIILMLERRALGVNGGIKVEDFDYERVFDYFAAEIFIRLESVTRDFLLKSALLQIINVEMAEQLTGNASAARLLAGLNRHHLFTERLSGSDGNYQYHPLFREFLLNRLEKEYHSEGLSCLRWEAAKLLEKRGRWEEAAHHYSQSGRHEDLAKMVKRHARELLVQGRNRVIAEWIACMPSDRLQNDPWLLYWKGISSFLVDLPHTRMFLERAMQAFTANNDPSGIYLSWAGIVDTYAFGNEWKRLDDCIADFEKLDDEIPLYPSKEIELVASSRMLLALSLRKPDDPEKVVEWLKRVTELLQQNPSFDIQMETIFCMSVYYLWKGEYERNAVLLEHAAVAVRDRLPSPFTLIRIKLMKGIHSWITADYRDALQTLGEGLEVSAKSGVHIYDSLLWSFKAAAEMAPGNLEDAEISLREQMKSLIGMETPLNLFFFHINSAWHALLTGRPSIAKEHMESISVAVRQMDTPYYWALWNLGMAQITFALGRTDEAMALIRQAREISLAMRSQVMEWYSLLIDAWFQLEQGKEKKGVLSLRRGLSLGRLQGFVHLEFYLPAVMRTLFAKALEENIEPGYVKRLIRKLTLTPPVAANGSASSAPYPEEWPYPVKIYTLGRFEIIKDDEPLLFSGKEQKKPLDLLKSLIAFGGRDVPEDRLTDALWPDADGDLAHKSFETTLGRLRRLLGGDPFIICRARRLSLNPLYCWVDSLALGHLLDTLREAPPWVGAMLHDRALAMYRGAFLGQDAGLTCAMVPREILKNGILGIILTTGRACEEAVEWERAAGYYSKGIALDNLAEEFYRRLMVCHLRQGNHAAAATAYNHCRSLLRAELGIEPSPETTAVYSAIAQKS